MPKRVFVLCIATISLFENSCNGDKNEQRCSKITRFIDKYRASISTDIMQSGEYSFKAFLIQVANHKSVDALPVQFFPYDKLTDDEKRKLKESQD